MVSANTDLIVDSVNPVLQNDIQYDGVSWRARCNFSAVAHDVSWPGPASNSEARLASIPMIRTFSDAGRFANFCPNHRATNQMVSPSAAGQPGYAQDDNRRYSWAGKIHSKNLDGFRLPIHFANKRL